MNSGIPDAVLSVDGYDFIHVDRASRGGGVGIYIRNSLEFESCNVDYGIEQVCIILRMGRFSVAFFVVYRAPAQALSLFLDCFESAIVEVFPKVDQLLCVGDFDVNLLNETN